MKPVVSTALCIPHFFEYTNCDDLQTGKIVVEEAPVKFFQD